MKMKHLIEHYERELVEVDPATLFKAGYGLAGAIATSPAWVPLAGKAANAAVGALFDRHKKKKNAADMTAWQNKRAEQCHKRGDDNCACADGFHYDSSAKKCVKNTGSGIKRFFKKK